MRLKTFVLALALLIPTQVFAQPTVAPDMVNLSAAQIVDAPDVRNWARTTSITSIAFDGANTRIEFTKKDGPDRWPDVTPAGWSGPLEYTIWLCLQSNGSWACSGFIQMWNGRDGAGDAPSDYAKNWYYAERWSPLFGHGPIRPGEQIGFMVTSGNARDNAGPFSVQERSNVVTLPATDNGSFTFPTSGPVPTPVPVPVPTPMPTPTPSPVPTTDLSGIFSQAAINHAAEMAELEELKMQLAQARQDIADFRAAVRSKYLAVVDSPIFKYALAAVSGFLLTHKWGQ